MKPDIGLGNARRKGVIDILVRLLAGHDAIVRRLRQDAVVGGDRQGDAGTGAFLTGLVGEHEKMAWMPLSFAG